MVRRRSCSAWRRCAAMSLARRHRMLRLDRVSVSIRPGAILREIGLHVDAAEFAGLIGRNGAVKTILLRTIIGLMHATGALEFDGVRLADIPTHHRARLGIG